MYLSIWYSYNWPTLALCIVCSVARAATAPTIALPAPFLTATFINLRFLIATFKALQGLPQYLSKLLALEWRLKKFKYQEPNEFGNFSPSNYKVKN